jgi:hypothetical protein
MRRFTFVPTHRRMTRAEWKWLDRCARIINRDYGSKLDQAMQELFIYGSSVCVAEQP